MGHNKEKNIELLNRRIIRDKELLMNWKTNNISERKITKLETKIAREEAELTELENL